jgi:hypothetical protein
VESKTVNVVVIDGKKVEKTITLQHGQNKTPVIVDAVGEGKYLLAENDTGFAPENITAKRVGDDLYITLEGEQTDTPDLIIRDYYQMGGELVGKGEDGAYYNYVTAYGQESADITAETPTPLALGQESIPDFSEGLLVQDDDNTWLWALLGFGALATAGIIAMTHDSNDSKTHSDAPPDDTTVVHSGTLDSVIDKVGTIQGAIADGGVTDDNKPTFNGSGVTPGNIVLITDGETVIGSTTADENGTWSFTPDTPLSDGSHDFSVVVVDDKGNQSDPSNDITVIIDTVAPGPAVVEVTDNAGQDMNGGTSNDTAPVISGDAEPGTVVIISDNGETIGSVQVDDNGEWSFTPTDPLDEGDHDISVVVVDDAGNVSPASDDISFVIDTTPPDAATDLVLMDDVGDVTGPILSGDVTDDSQPAFSGKAEPDATVIISDNGQEIGSVVVDENGNWSFTPDTLPDGDHSFTTIVEDAAGNQSQPSEAIDFTVETPAPIIVTGSENFENVDNFVFSAPGDSIALDSGLTVTFVDGRVDGAGMNAYTEISDKGMFFFGPEEMGEKALMLIESSETKFEFGGGTSAVSFDVNASSFEGSSVSFYDANGNLLNDEPVPLPVQADGDVQTISWAAPEGEQIASMVITTGPGSVSNVITRVDNIAWGDEAVLPVTPEGTEVTDTYSMMADGMELDYSALALADSHTDGTPVAHHGTMEVHGNTALSLEDLLSNASQDLFIADGKTQVAITGDEGSHVAFDSASVHEQNWTDVGQTTAGGVTYNVYQQQDGMLELLVQQGVELQHA